MLSPMETWNKNNANSYVRHELYQALNFLIIRTKLTHEMKLICVDKQKIDKVSKDLMQITSFSTEKNCFEINMCFHSTK